ncbi:sugar ABC transporter permease [Frigoribacterium sp. CFBP 8766]|uniref:carbohydrate ABC transporter permease n=1 Tax=Frigoribacterium sp. CFBP 8766 TaxID=2775273 RepID=UPI00177D98F7|nr:sugar ABC transporter permease [Frigoribacterium sp. CFBP 8766]MBD8583689.1 sugar ABC transporter permease [Frigoribacterium sp. CFBP 8766]
MTALPGARRPGRRAARLRENLVGWAFIGPNLVLLSVFLLVPILWAVQLSFQETRGFGDPEWVGGANYARMVADPVFWQTLGNTVLFTVVTVPVEMALGLGLAVLLDGVLPGRRTWRTMLVLPMVISGVASAMIAVILFTEANGLVNKVLRALGLGSVPWQSDGALAMVSVIVTMIWLRVGLNMIIYLAGLQSVSPELYEAAELDGAGAWQRFRSITVPLVGPSTFFLLVLNVIASFQVFDLVFVLTGGGPGYSTSVLGTYAYRNGFQIREQGYGAALGVVILVVTLAFTVVQWRTNRTRDLTE